MIVSLTEVKAYINKDDADISADTLLTSLIVACQNQIENYLNYVVESGSITYEFIGIGELSKYLTFVPVTSVTSVSRRANPLNSWETVSNTKYALYSANGLNYLYYEDGFSTSYQYKVIVVQGYSSVPKEIKQCCIELVADRYFETVRGTLGMSQQTQDNAGTTSSTVYSNIWNNRIMDRLSVYRAIPV